MGMFIWAKVADKVEDTHTLIDDLLHNARVFITPGDVFGSNGKRFIRISLCSDEKIYDKAIANIKLWQDRKLRLAL